jgi:hypothetical protein
MSAAGSFDRFDAVGMARGEGFELDQVFNDGTQRRVSQGRKLSPRHHHAHSLASLSPERDRPRNQVKIEPRRNGV